jgi:hypothetical protein
MAFLRGVIQPFLCVFFEVAAWRSKKTDAMVVALPEAIAQVKE